MRPARANSTDHVNEKSAAAQPRPALGRRPWFALLRRARSLRRFALAIGPGSVAGFADPVAIVAQDGSWEARRVALARTHRQRRLGVKSATGPVLLRTRAVHARGLGCALQLVGIADTGMVVGCRVLLPGRFAWVAEAKWILELPLDAPSPKVGAALAIYAQPRARTTPLVCNPDR